MKRIPPSLTTALAALTALSLGAGDLMAAKKKDGKKSGRDKGKKAAVHRESNRRTHAAKPARSSRTLASRSKSRGGGRSHQVARRASSHRSQATRHRLASASPRTTFQHREKGKELRSRPSRTVHRTTAASRSKGHVARSRSPQRPLRRNSAVASREHRSRAGENRTHFASRHREGPRSHGGHHRHTHDRDRSRYVHRHGSHSHDWYRRHGWSYDPYYWQTHRRHRYYNDIEQVYVINPTGPAYQPGYYGYNPPARRYDYSAGYDLETRLAVQAELARTGYYYGAIDGQIGPRSRDAIYAYQQDNGLPTTGNIDDDLIDSLGIGY